MAKKKAIKLAAASAVAASAFVAAAPAQTDAASNVAVEVSKAVTQMKKAYHTYSDVTANGEFAPIADVYKEYNAAKKAYANAKALVNKAGGADKDKHLANLDGTYAEYITKRVIPYIDAYNYAQDLKDVTVELNDAVEAGELDDAETAYHAVSKELRTRTVIFYRVHGKSTRDLFLSDYKAKADNSVVEVREEVTIKMAYDAAEKALEEGNLEEAQKQFDKVAEYLKDLDTDTEFGKALSAKVEAAQEKFEELSVPKVESVSAINAKQVVVKFNKEVDVTTAETEGNYDFTEITGSAIGANPALAEVQADGKSVVLTLTTPITVESTFTTTVSGVKVKGTDYDFFPQFAVSTKYKDEVKASVTDVTSVTNGSAATSLTVAFSEPVASATYKVNGTTYPAVLSADGFSATISGLSLDATKSHSLEVLNLTDYGNNVTSHTAKTFNVTKDVANPNITVSALNDNQLLLTFDKRMNASTVNTTNVKVKDELLTDLTLGQLVADPNDTTGKKFIADLPAGLYTSKDSRNLTVLLNDLVTDSLGNKLPTQFKTVTVTKDVTAPTATNATFVKNPSTGNVSKVVLEFSEGLAASAGYSTAGIKVISPSGVDVTTGFFAANSAAVVKGSNKIELTVNATVNSGKYTLYLPNGLVTDVAQTANNSVASTKVVDFGTASSSEFKIAQSAIGGTPSATTNVITVNYGTTVKGGAQAGSATDLNNYTLNGAPLPTGTLITLDSGLTTATITIPDESIATTDTAAVLRITGVQNSVGTVLTPFVGTANVTDSKAPVLSTAVLNTNGTITVGFGETLATPALLSDFDVTINGKTVAASELNFTAAVGADAGKYVISVDGLVSDNATVGDTSDDFLYINADGVAGYQAATDIKVTGVAATASDVNLNASAITSVTVATKAAGPLTGADTAGNTLKVNVSKAVK